MGRKPLYLVLGFLLLGCASLRAQPIAVTGSESVPDGTGAYTIVLDLEGYMPVTIKPNQSWEAEYQYRLAGGLRIRRVRSFYAVNRGDVFEGHLLVLAEDFYLHNRGPHKERRLGEYDAWAVEAVDYTAPAAGANINVFALCYPTIKRLTGCHVGVILEVEPVSAIGQ